MDRIRNRDCVAQWWSSLLWDYLQKTNERTRKMLTAFDRPHKLRISALDCMLSYSMIYVMKVGRLNRLSLKCSFTRSQVLAYWPQHQFVSLRQYADLILKNLWTISQVHRCTLRCSITDTFVELCAYKPIGKKHVTYILSSDLPGIGNVSQHFLRKK